jgi:hypothetical protein
MMTHGTGVITLLRASLFRKEAADQGITDMVAPSPPGGSKGLVIGLVRQGCGTSGQVCPRCVPVLTDTRLGVRPGRPGGVLQPDRSLSRWMCAGSAHPGGAEERAGNGTGGPRSPVDVRSAAHRR